MIRKKTRSGNLEQRERLICDADPICGGPKEAAAPHGPLNSFCGLTSEGA
jgi:hypothetical protein